MKKFVSLVLALALTMALAIPAFASGNTENSTSQSTAMSATTKGLEIKLKVNATAAITFNPYKMQIEVNGNASTAQIVSPAVFITSQTKIPLSIDAVISGTVPTPGSGETADDYFAFASKTTAGVTGKKQGFVFWEIAKANDADTEPKWTDVDKASAALQQDATDAEKEAGNFSSIALVKVGNTTAKKGVYTMPAAGDDPVYAAFHVAGDAVVNPASSSKPNAVWTDKDVFTVNVALTFNPAST